MMRVKKNKLYSFLAKTVMKSRCSITEDIEVYAGEGDDKLVIIDDGLKLVHQDSKLVYTVTNVVIRPDGKPEIHCYRPGQEIVIMSDQFKDYERL